MADFYNKNQWVKFLLASDRLRKLLAPFIELIKNPQFKFWSHQFVHCAPEIEK